MTRLGRAAAVIAAAVLVAGGVTSCGSDDEAAAGESASAESSSAGTESEAERETEGESEEGGGAAADVSTCTADASPAPTPYGDGFPADWPFPPDTVVFNAEDRGSMGIIVTAVTSSSFQTVLDFMNGDVADAGYVVEQGETEEHDAEAEWDGNSFRGRWAIRESANCEGETVIQVLSTND